MRSTCHALLLVLLAGCPDFPEGLLSPRDRGPADRAAGPDGTAREAAALDRKLPDSSLTDGTVHDSSPPDGTVHDGPLPDGTVHDSSPPDGTVHDSSPPDGSVHDGLPPDTLPPVPGTWVTISAAAFYMGSPSSEACRSTNEDQHQVTLSFSFDIQSTEVTQGQYLSVMGTNPSIFTACGAACPVDSVTWHQAAAYCNALSTSAGLKQCYTCSGSGASTSCDTSPAYKSGKLYTCPGYRLCTDAEWELACRGGTMDATYEGAITACSSNDNTADMIGWYVDNSGGAAHLAAQKKANAWGLYDMPGNVLEWCHDWYTDSLGTAAVTDPWGPATGTTRVLRGGSWGDTASSLRSAYRHPENVVVDFTQVGLRCCRSK